MRQLIKTEEWQAKLEKKKNFISGFSYKNILLNTEIVYKNLLHREELAPFFYIYKLN